jgi:class 3 adenylate cyclase
MRSSRRADLAVSQTFVFADLAGFTAMTEAMGDESAAELAERFCERLEADAPAFGAEALKRIGDAVMLRCEQAGDAVRLGLHATHEIGNSHYLPTVRVGMHTGDAVKRGGDWFGAAVNLAARVSGEASGREVLLTEQTRRAAGDVPGVALRERGRRTLHNVAEPVVLYAAVREGERSDAGLPIDPVCRMVVDPERSAGRVVHDGREYYFCSLRCVALFAQRPGEYASVGST